MLWYTVYGFLCGVWFLVYTMLNADIFGRASLGRVNGVVLAMNTASAGLGPLAFGWCRDTTGSYGVVMTTLLVGMAMFTALLALRKVPIREHSGRKPAVE